MPQFIFTARNIQGKTVHGLQEAQTENDAINSLQSRNLLVTKIRQAGSQAQGRAARPTHRRHYRVKAEDLLFFASQTGTLLEAGIPVLKALEVGAEQSSSGRLYAVLNDVKESIKAGTTLRDALARHPKVFPPIWAHLVEAGESSGNLPLSLSQIANHLEFSLNLKKKIVSALVYPAVLILGAVGAVSVFLLKIIPVFAKLFSSFNAELPFLTRMVIRVSHIAERSFFWAVALVAVGIYFLNWALSRPAGRAILDRIIISVPVFGSFIRETILARIAINLASLIKSGVSIIKSLEVTAHASGNTVFEAALLDIAHQVQQGKPLSACFKEKEIFPPLIVQLTIIGEESGKLPDMISRLAKYYEGRVEVFVSRLSVLLEPMVLVFVGGIVGLLVTAMFLPIFSISSIIK